MQRQSFKVLILFNKDWLHFSEENCADHRVWEISVEWKISRKFFYSNWADFWLEFLKISDDKEISISQGKTKTEKLICSQFHFVKFFTLEITLKIISALHRSVEIRFFRYFFYISWTKDGKNRGNWNVSINDNNNSLHHSVELSRVECTSSFYLFYFRETKSFSLGFLEDFFSILLGGARMIVLKWSLLATPANKRQNSRNYLTEQHLMKNKHYLGEVCWRIGEREMFLQFNVLTLNFIFSSNIFLTSLDNKWNGSCFILLL